jgi:hypothetical protein
LSFTLAARLLFGVALAGLVLLGLLTPVGLFPDLVGLSLTLAAMLLFGVALAGLVLLGLLTPVGLLADLVRLDLPLAVLRLALAGFVLFHLLPAGGFFPFLAGLFVAAGFAFPITALRFGFGFLVAGVPLLAEPGHCFLTLLEFFALTGFG